MKGQSRNHTKRSTAVAMTFGLLFLSPSLPAQTPDLSVDDAVKQALKNNNGIQSAVEDANASVEAAAAAKLRLLPSLSLSAGYTKLSDLGQQTLDIPFGQTKIPVTFPAAPTNAYSFGASLRYPVFAGFRLTQAAKIADLQTLTKQASLRMVREAIAFEVRRAYWETVRAAADVALLRKSWEVTKALVQEVRDEVNLGLATESDRLSAEERQTQAAIALGNASSFEAQALLALASLTGNDTAARKVMAGALAADSGAEVALPYRLTSSPADLPRYRNTSPIDLPALLSQAMGNRGDLRAAGLGVRIAVSAKRIAAAGLYPTVAAIGDYTYANPNQRVFPPTGDFTGTWDVGVQLSFDIGGLPATAAKTRAAESTVRAAELQRNKQEQAVVLDVQKTALALKRARENLDLIRSSVEQTKENVRVVTQKFDNGAAKHTDVLEAELSLLKAQFGVTNGEIGVQIAAADLARAASMQLP